MWRTVVALFVCFAICTASGCGASYTDPDSARDQVKEADALEAQTQQGEIDSDEEEE